MGADGTAHYSILEIKRALGLPTCFRVLRGSSPYHPPRSHRDLGFERVLFQRKSRTSRPFDVAAEASTPEGSIERELLWLLCMEIFGDVFITGSRVPDPFGEVSDLLDLLNTLPCSSRLLLALAEPAWALKGLAGEGCL